MTNPTPRYRMVSDGRDVDQTLFGTKDNNSINSMTKKTRKVVSSGSIAPSSTIISMTEFERIKGSSIIKSDSELNADREEALRQKESRELEAKNRKIRMKELEKKAVLMAKKSNEEVAQLAKEDALRKMAAEKIDMNSDVVKLLTSMSCKATAYSLRDNQIQEKKDREQVEREYDRRMDIIMEIDRLKDIQFREQDERDKRTKRMEDRKTINEQIDERHRKKLMDAESKEQENVIMKNQMKKYKDEDAIKEAARKIRVEKSMAEVSVANQDSIRRKLEARQKEKQEMEDILVYQALKDAELLKREKEEEAQEHLKKERQAKLLAQQERAQNNAGKLDELRARRAAEEKERRERTKEKAEHAKKKSEMKELVDSRARQAADKVDRQARMKIAEEEEYNNALIYMRTMAIREEKESEHKKKLSDQHRNNIMNQIKSNEVRRNLISNATTDEGTQFKQDLIREETKLGVIRDKMVEKLAKQGVNPAYLSEMQNVDISKILNR